MGQEIVYCSACSTQVRGPDFERGKAFKVRDQVFCASCRPDLVREASGKALSSSRGAIPAAPFLSSSQFRKVSTDLPREHSRGWVVGWLAAGALILGSVLLLRSSRAPIETVVPIARENTGPLPPAESPPLDPKRTESSPLRDPGEDARLLEERVRRKVEDAKAPEPPERGKTAPKNALPSDHEDPNPGTSPAPPPPAPPPAAPEPVRPEWRAALAPTLARDFGAALAALRKLPPSVPDALRDLELLGQVAELHRRATEILSKMPKGQKLVLCVREDCGGTRRVEGTVLRAEAGRVLLKANSKVEEVELGEVLPSSLAEVAAAGGKAPAALATGLFSLLEGDVEAASKILGDERALIPERYWGYARQVRDSQLRPDPLRALYDQALKDFSSFSTASRGARTVQELLRDHPNDPFVARNKASLLDRAQGARDFLFMAEDLRAAGALRAAKGGKAETFWTSDGDPEAGKAKENYLDAVFSTLPDLAYKCWILAGGCCMETFEFSCQGSEFLTPPVKGVREPATPGAFASLPVRPYISGLKKSHSAHTGPKHAARWEWVQVSLPKYAGTGPECLRILFDQRGFSVGAICVSASRSGPPSEADLKEWMRSRGDRPKVELVQPPKVIPIVRCLFDGTDRRLVGNLEKGALSGIPLYEKCFAGLERSEPITVPPKGELRATYFVRTATTLTFRLRIERGPDQTVPYDFVAEKPAVGVPTEIRIPLPQFKAINQPGTPAVAPGDRTTMIYIFGDAIDCGLRLDALSLVEIRAPEGNGDPVRTAAELRPGAGLWKPIFDGRSLRGFASGIENAWRVEDGRIVHDNSVDNAAQSQDDFGDGEIRIRFETRGVRRFFAAVRQDGKGGSFSTSVGEDEIASLQKGEHELLFSCRGQEVSATLDGKPRRVDAAGLPRAGRIQFNSFEGSFRILALDYRESR